MKATLALEQQDFATVNKSRRAITGLEHRRQPALFQRSSSAMAAPRPRAPARRRVSAFGFGGSNYHAVLEASPQNRQRITWDRDLLAFAWSAADANALSNSIAQAPAADASRTELQTAAAKAEQIFSLMQHSAPLPCAALLSGQNIVRRLL